MSLAEFSRNISEEISHLFEAMAEAPLPEPLLNLDKQRVKGAAAEQD